jgi:hypothetical protein
VARHPFDSPLPYPGPPRLRTAEVNTRNGVLIPINAGPKNYSIRPVEFGEALPAGTRLTLFSDDKPDRFFTVIKFWMDETSGVALALNTGVPTYQVEDEEGRTHLLIHLPIEEEDEDRWCLWRPDHAGFESRSIFEGALVSAGRRTIPPSWRRQWPLTRKR